MNFKHVLRLSLWCVALLAAASCNSSEPLPDIEQSHTFTSSKLRLTYCGETMPAKVVTATPDGADALTLTAEGITDLSMLSSMGLSGTAPAPGVLPGSPVVTLPAKLKASGSKYIFEGSGASDFCSSFAYSGFLEGDSLILNIDNVVLSNDCLSGSIWTPVPFRQEGLSVKSTPFHLLWEIDPTAGIDIDLTGALETLVTLPIIPVYQHTAYSSVAQLLSMSLQTVAFNQNGNIFVRYFSSVGGATQLMTSTGNTLQYVVLGDKYMRLYPNPTTLFGLWLVAQSDSAGIPDISFTKAADDSSDSRKELLETLMPLVKSMLPSVLEMTREGIPLEMSKSDASLDIYLNTDLILTLLQQLATAVNENPDVIAKLMGMAAADAEMAELLSTLQQLLPRIDALLKATTRMEIGLSFNKYQQ